MHYIKSQLGDAIVTREVISQRHLHVEQCTLHTIVDGEERLTGKIDLARLGLNKAQIAEVERLKDIELSEGAEKPGFVAAVDASRAGGRTMRGGVQEI